MMLNEKGFSLLEVFISIVIIAIGFISVAGMQTTATTGNLSASDMTIAVQLAEEMAERIRVNGTNNPGVYNNLSTTNCGGLVSPALGDCNQWKTRLEDANLNLPSATGSVVVVSDSPINNTATVTITVTWGRIVTRSVTFTTIVETWLT